MESAQLETLKKLLALSASENEHEAMAAIRQANKLLKGANKTWTDVLEAGLNTASKKYEQLHLQHVALANKYNELLQLVARQRAASTIMMPQMRMPRRRSRRF